MEREDDYEVTITATEARALIDLLPTNFEALTTALDEAQASPFQGGASTRIIVTIRGR
jgi:hypothetical protein